jgi:Family of unknown function (DUF6318)
LPFRDVPVPGRRVVRVTIDHVFSRAPAALTAVLLLLLAACSGSDEPADRAQGDTGEAPAYADNAGTAGAEQFVGYWTDTLNEATTSGETQQLKSLATDACEACADFAGRLDSIYAAGGRVESEGWEVAKVVPEAGASDDEVGLFVTFAVAPQRVYESEDAKVQEFEGGNQGFRFHLLREDGDWRVTDLTPR